MKRYMIHLFFLIASISGVSLWFNVNASTQVLFAQEAEETPIKVVMEGESATIRTPREMEQAEMEQAEAERGLKPAYVRPFVLTMDPAEYKARKAAANLEAAKTLKAEEFEERELLEPEPHSPPTLRGIDFNGINQMTVECLPPDMRMLVCAPPDTHGAVGPFDYVQVVNSRVVVYDKAGSQRSSRSLEAFFGALGESPFDPRVVYDRLYDRWVIVATRLSTSAMDDSVFFFLAVSMTPDPADSYFIYRIRFSLEGGIDQGDWLDFPQLGMDRDAVIVTGAIGDVPTSTTYKFTTVVASMAKAQIYNGVGRTTAVFIVRQGFFLRSLARSSAPLAPPIVLDNNPRTFFVGTEENGRFLLLYRGENLSSATTASLTFQTVVGVANYRMPPDAPQCGTTVLLNTNDGRFLNASTQVGNSLWNIHTIAPGEGGFARPRFYEIGIEGAGANTVKRTGVLAATVFDFPGLYTVVSSFDFNASIAVNDFGEAFVTWTSTQPRNLLFGIFGINCRNADMRFSGFQPTDDASLITPGSVVFSSTTALTEGSDGNPQLWGDYSAVALDPEASDTCLAGRRAWIVNETIVNATTWGSHISRIGFCD